MKDEHKVTEIESDPGRRRMEHARSDARIERLESVKGREPSRDVAAEPDGDEGTIRC